VESAKDPKDARSGARNAPNVARKEVGRREYSAQTFAGNGKTSLHARACGAEGAIL